jgi:cell division transport system ATP-binding protein
MIELSHVYKTYVAEQHILKNLSLNVNKGDFVFLMGPSGAGKTTLFRLVTGFEKVSSGQIRINGFDLNKLNLNKRAAFRRSIGVVFQDFKLLEDRNVFENVALPLQIMGYKKWDIVEKTEKMIRKVGLSKKINENPSYLSGGEKQRVAIARALVHDPSLVIADEPTGNLDWRLSEEILGLFKEANQKKGTTLLIATHDFEIVKATPNKRLIQIEKGQLFEKGEDQPCGRFFAPLKEAGLNIL